MSQQGGPGASGGGSTHCPCRGWLQMAVLMAVSWGRRSVWARVGREGL